MLPFIATLFHVEIGPNGNVARYATKAEILATDIEKAKSYAQQRGYDVVSMRPKMEKIQ